MLFQFSLLILFLVNGFIHGNDQMSNVSTRAVGDKKPDRLKQVAHGDDDDNNNEDADALPKDCAALLRQEKKKRKST